MAAWPLPRLLKYRGHDIKTNPNFLHYYRGNPSNLPIHWVVFDAPKDGSYNLMTPDIETYLNDLMTEWQHKWQTSSPLSFFQDKFFQVHLEHLLVLPMDSLPSKSEMHKNPSKNQGGDCRPGPTPSVESKLFDGSESSRKTRFHRFGCIKNLGEILGETKRSLNWWVDPGFLNHQL